MLSFVAAPDTAWWNRSRAMTSLLLRSGSVPVSSRRGLEARATLHALLLGGAGGGLHVPTQKPASTHPLIPSKEGRTPFLLCASSSPPWRGAGHLSEAHGDRRGGFFVVYIRSTRFPIPIRWRVTPARDSASYNSALQCRGLTSLVEGRVTRAGICAHMFTHLHSHSMVAGGLELMSYTTRLMPRTSLMIRFDMVASVS